MKLTVPHDLTHEQARLALSLLELLIDSLIELYQEMSRAYDIRHYDEDLPF